MTKLEKKLIELGYEKKELFYVKSWKENLNKIIVIKNNKIDYFLDNYNFEMQKRMFVRIRNSESIQQAFNEMQKDLEILKDIDKPTPKNDIGNELWEKDVKHMQELGEWERKQWNY